MVGYAMASILGIMAANQTQFVKLPCQKWHVLADANAGNPRGDGAKFAANLGRGIRLWIEGIDMARPALHPQEDAIDGSPRGGTIGRRPAPQAQEGRQR